MTATLNNKQADGGLTASAEPAISPALFTGDTENFSEAYLTSAAASGKTLHPSGHANDGNGGLNYNVTIVDITNGNIYPAPAKTLTFTAQPLDAEVSTPIFNVCATSGTTAPCASSVSAPTLPLTTKSTPVQVTVRDAYGNLAGTGAPGAEANVVDVKVTVRRDTSSGVVLTSNVSTSNGVAKFNDALIIAATGNSNKLYAVATSGQVLTPSDTSSNFRVVTDLYACDGRTCDNNGNNGLAANQLQRAAGKINTGADFYVAGSTNVLLSTQFVPGTETNQAACGNNKTIGQATDLRATGQGVGGTTPSTIMVMVMPKNTLKFYGVTARSATSFDICLGALKIDPTSPITKWKAKNPKKSGLVDSALGSDTEGRQWGVPANCGTAGLSAVDPCIGLRTKQTSELRTYLAGQGWTTAEINAIGMADADVAFVIRKGSPWDAKGGAY